MGNDTIILKLKTPMTEVDGRPIKKLDQVKSAYNEKGQQKSIEEIRAEVPDFTYGEGIADFLMHQLQPADAAELARQNRIARKIANASIKATGELHADESFLKDCISLLEKVPLKPNSAHMLGDCINFLRDAQDELRLKQKA